MSEHWSTKEQIAAAMERFETSLEGWVRPVAHGVTVPGQGFATVNVREHMLPAIVLATVLGYRSGTASCPVSRALLAEAITLLAPAEACADYDHPNLAAWRRIHDDASGADPLAVAVFVASMDDSPTDAETSEFLELLKERQ